MGQDLGEYIIGSKVQLVVEFEDLNGSSIDPTNPKYAVLWLNENTGSFIEALPQTDLTKYAVGIYYGLYDSTTIGSIGNYSVIYSGSIIGNPYDDVDTFRIGSGVSGGGGTTNYYSGGGDGGISGTEIELLKKISNMSTQKDVGSLNEKLNQLVKVVNKIYETTVSKDMLDAANRKIGSELEEIKSMKDVIEEQHKNITQFRIALGENHMFIDNKLDLFKKNVYETLEFRDKELKNIIMENSLELNKNNSQLKDTINNSNHFLQDLQERIVTSSKLSENEFKKTNNLIDLKFSDVNLKFNSIDNKFETVSKDFLTLNKENGEINRELNNFKESAQISFNSIKDRIETHLFSKFTEAEEKQKEDISGLKIDVRNFVQKLNDEISNDIKKLNELEKNNSNESQIKSNEIKKLLNDKMAAITAIINNNQDVFDCKIEKLNEKIDSSQLEIKEKLMFKFNNLKNDIELLKNEMYKIVDVNSKDMKTDMGNRVNTMTRKLSDVAMNQQIEMLRK